MTEFLTVLALYYACNSTAALRPLAPDEVVRCSATYAQVKGWFRPGWDTPEDTAARARMNREAYLAFKAWEADNPVLVDRMQDRARAAVARAHATH